MVKVIERTHDEELNIIKKMNLETVARELVKDGNINPGLYTFGLYNNSIIVIPRDNELLVGKADKLDLAIDLASRYEDMCKEEFIVKKNYCEPNFKT